MIGLDRRTLGTGALGAPPGLDHVPERCRDELGLGFDKARGQSRGEDALSCGRRRRVGDWRVLEVVFRLAVVVEDERKGPVAGAEQVVVAPVRLPEWKQVGAVVIGVLAVEHKVPRQSKQQRPPQNRRRPPTARPPVLRSPP